MGRNSWLTLDNVVYVRNILSIFFFSPTLTLSPYPLFFLSLQDPAGIFELVEVVGNGTYGQVYKVG